MKTNNQSNKMLPILTHPFANDFLASRHTRAWARNWISGLLAIAEPILASKP
jgi:hypothetical protein